MSPESGEEMRAFEASLRHLAPRADRLDGHRLMYLAGRAAALAERQSRPSRSWAVLLPISVAAAVAALLAGALLLRIGPGPPGMHSPDQHPLPSAEMAATRDHPPAQQAPHISSGITQPPSAPPVAGVAVALGDPAAATAPSGHRPNRGPFPAEWASPRSQLAIRALLVDAVARGGDIGAAWPRVALPAEASVAASKPHRQQILTPWTVRSAQGRGLFDMNELAGGPGS